MLLCSIHSCFQRWKNYKNPPRETRVIVEKNVASFYPDTVYFVSYETTALEICCVLQRAAAMVCQTCATSTRRCTKRLVMEDTALNVRKTLTDHTASDANTSSIGELRLIDVCTAPAIQSASCSTITNCILRTFLFQQITHSHWRNYWGIGGSGPFQNLDGPPTFYVTFYE